MNSSVVGDPGILDHELAEYFPELLKFESTPEMEASTLYREIRPEIDRIFTAVVTDAIADSGSRNADSVSSQLNDQETLVVQGNPRSAIWNPKSITALAWNIERGSVYEVIVDALKNHE